MDLFRKKSVDQLVSESTPLKRTLKTFDLTMLGIGAIIGTGIFVLTGKGALTAGPALCVSFLLAAICCGFAGLCYAEFAAMAPVSGSAYSYAYLAFGELIAFVIGWDLILEYALQAATVSAGWSGYFNKLLEGFGLHLPVELTAAYGTTPGVTTYFNLPGFVIVLIITWVLSIGINQTKKTNDIMVMIKLAIIVLFIVCAVWYVKPSNWQPFSPYGIYTFQPGSTQPYGIVPAASIVFFSFIGFDAGSLPATILNFSGPTPWFVLFVLITGLVVIFGVQKGIENASRLMMPVLAVLIVVIALYSLTIPGALAGVKYYLMPDFSQFSASTVLGACGQMFYSMSLAMGITITYGSYMPKENLLEHSVTQIEIFDTLFAFFAGLMIIPAVIAFNGGDPSQVNSGPSLMFISLPMVFDSMKFGTVIGAVFFLLVLFAALTSSIALMETLASVIMDKFKLKRIPATLIIIAICLVVGMLSCLGYGPWESITIIGMQFLDFFDFISNSVLMPIVAVLTCVLIGHVVGTRVVADEVKSGAGSFHREKLHRVMIRWIAPILLVAILASELASKIFGVFSI